MNNPSHLHLASAPIPRAVARAHAELLTHSDLQFDFPKFVPAKSSDWFVRFLKFLGSFGSYPKYVFWTVVIIGALLLAFLIGREIFRRIAVFEKKTQAPTRMPEWRPSPRAAKLLLQDVDVLAAQGRFTEAVHLLLLRSIQDIDERNPNLLKPALTSREIGALDQLPSAARPAFAYMARVVESALFGDRDAGASDFAQCREAYERFAFPSQWAAA